MSLVEVYADERVLMCHEGALFLCGWSDAPTATQMKALGEHGRRVEAEHGPSSLINIAFGGVPKFSDEVRALAAEATADASRFQRSRAHVVMIGGFTGVAVVAFINTFVLRGKPPRPTKIFRSTDDAIAWTAPHMSPPGDALAIAELVADLKRRLAPQLR
ncbi:MAG TPA: hypothetical protein VG755_03595 [Nannocystaceae bacterium]|nr:hypothetical protein [Nannocystaceae bacterium]